MLYSLKYIFSIIFVISSIEGHLKDKTKKIYIGSAISANALSTDSQYKTIAAQEFNCVTPENSMKWDAIEKVRGHPNYTLADKLVKFAKQHGMKLRGHTLIWYKQMPAWVETLGHNKTELELVMKKHIKEVMTHFKGSIYAWDVLNEVLSDNGSLRDSIWHRVFGNSFIGKALRIAHSIDPNAKLYINDYTIEGKNKKSDALFGLVKALKAQGVPIHGVGMQAHLPLGQVPKDIAENMKRFSDLGLDVAITELDIISKLPTTQALFKRQARDYAQVFSACLSVHRCVGVTVWGFTDKYSWIPNVFKGYGAGDLWDKDLKPKPAVDAINKVLK